MVTGHQTAGPRPSERRFILSISVDRRRVMKQKPEYAEGVRLLLLRYCELGNLLPRDDLATAFQDAGARAEAEIVLREMSTVKQEIDSFLAAARERVPP